MALLVHRVRQHFRDAEPVALEVDGLSLRFDAGELFLDGKDPRTPAAGLDDRGARDEALRALAHELAGRAVRETGDGPPPESEVGPFPAAVLASELATIGIRPDAVAKRFGGREGFVKATVPAVPVGHGVPEDVLDLINRLDRPTAIAELIDPSRGRIDDVVRQLAVLHTLGLVRRADDPNKVAAGRQADTLTIRLAERVSERLSAEPAADTPARQREEIASLWQRLGELDHYQLLDAPRPADAASVTAGFDRIARLVHADNAARLGLDRSDAMLATLFDRAVEAYRTLIDPDLRIAYNRTLAAAPAARIDPEQRLREKRLIAEENVQRALVHLSEQDVSIAVDLLKEAARLDPKADTWALLGKAQARNPKWLRHAVESWREAIALRPQWTEAYSALAEVLESLDRVSEAIETYRKVLELAPNDGAAQAALGRLGSAPAEPKKRRWGRG